MLMKVIQISFGSSSFPLFFFQSFSANFSFSIASAFSAMALSANDKIRPSILLVYILGLGLGDDVKKLLPSLPTL